MDDLLAWVAATDLASALRQSRWGYAAVNTLHVLGIALLVGAVVPLDLRLMGWWHEVEHPGIVRVLAPCAAAGLVTALTTGALLFSVGAPGYAANPAFLAKLVFIALGTVSAVAHHGKHGLVLQNASPAALRTAGMVSLISWLGAAISGRLIAYLGN